MDKALEIQREVQRILGTDEVYLVGGSVRDLVMGNTPKDYDFTTPLLPEEVEEKVKAEGRHVYAIGKKFGTIGFKVPYGATATVRKANDSFKYGTATVEKFEYVEVTTFRSEVYTSKSRKPEVQFVPSLDEDLARRDFTFNAMVLKDDGKIYDPYGGRLHIHSKKIVTVGMPKDRIQEDPLRMLRAARFAARYGFDIDPNFIGKARQLADRIYDVSIERWVQELDKIFTSPEAAWGCDNLHKMGLYERIFPELVREVDVSLDESTKEDWKIIPTIPFDCCGDIHVYDNADAAWKFMLDNLHENTKTGKYMASGICQRLKLSNDRTKIVLDK